MKIIQPARLYDYAKWYWERDHCKRVNLQHKIPEGVDAVEVYFKEHFSGKCPESHFNGNANWHIASLTEDEFARLMIVSSKEFTMYQGLVIPDEPRTLRNAARRAIDNRYPEQMKPTGDRQYRQDVIDNYLRWHLHYLPNHICQSSLEGNNRLTVCTLSDGEKRNDWPAGTYSYYLMDGFGRALPYMVLMLQGRIAYQPVEVFYAEKTLI